MGADLSLQCAPACDLTPPRIERLARVIRAIPDDDPDLGELLEALGYDDPGWAKACILAKCQEAQCDSRDVATLFIPGCPYEIRISGGMSWGDAPTAGFTILEHVERCPQAWQILEEFAREDFLANRSAAGNAPPPDGLPTRYVLYDFDADELATTLVYHSLSSAQRDADQLGNVVILNLPWSGRDEDSVCECQEPGFFYSGVPGILAHMAAGRAARDAKVERCDQCQRYPSDGAALARMKELGLA